MTRRSISFAGHVGDRVDDLIQILRDDSAVGRGATRADIVSALIYAAPVEPASLARLIRYGRMERFADEGEGLIADESAYRQCERTARALGWTSA